jgi:isopentenyl diphosphate isomerase/L-lactate dehydrogenase-like FMN-dependent dehydrogenase
VENVGWNDEESFYFALTEAAYKADVNLSIGDGCPDIKLQSGIQAINFLQQKNSSKSIKSAVFIKPYPNQKILERIDWSRDIAECIGVDIDSYNILTMRNLVQLERKTPPQIQELKNYAKLPFAIKGVFTKEDIELVKEIKPEIVVISNHGGRVENRLGSTAMFLKEYGSELKNYCGELWVDGGLRTKKDLKTASYFGVSEVMLGRPFITALCRGGEAEVKKMVEHLRG